jgi:hypothetical protein
MPEPRDTGRVRDCLVCGKPVESAGMGRPRLIHPECRPLRAKTYEAKRPGESR